MSASQPIQQRAPLDVHDRRIRVIVENCDPAVDYLQVALRLRAAVVTQAKLDDAEFIKAIGLVERITTGRPKKYAVRCHGTPILPQLTTTLFRPAAFA